MPASIENSTSEATQYTTAEIGYGEIEQKMRGYFHSGAYEGSVVF